MASYICTCKAVLDERGGYQFCPICGRRSARLSLPREWIPAPPEPGSHTAELLLQKEGPGFLPFHISLPMEGTGLEGVRAGRILDAAPHPIRLKLAEDAPKTLIGNLRVATPTGDRREAWWEEEVWEHRDIPFRITTRAPAQLELPVQRLLFPESQPRQRLYIWNRGDLSALVTLQAPVGFTVAGDSGETTVALVIVPSGGFAEVVVSRGPHATGGILRAQWEGGEHSVALEALQNRTGGFRPDHIVGIDFGSANTSVRLRDLKSGEVIAVGPPNYSGEIPLRFPSALWVARRSGEKPLLGQDAVNRYLTDPDAGFLVRGIKTLMRLQENPYQRFGAEWTTHRLLVLYLRSLKGLIEERAATHGIEDHGNILYVFCLPVLDAGPDYEAQQERMRRAAIEAGFPADDDDVTWFIEEPVAAALAVVRDVQEREGLAPDTHFCVVDAGGSTTDVTLGQVYLDCQNRYRFRPERTFALHFQLPEGARQAQYQRLWRLQGIEHGATEREVGGQMIDRLLAASWISPGGRLPDALWETLWPEAAYQGAAETRPDLDRRLWSVLNAVESLKLQLSNEQDQIHSLSREALWSLFLHHADTVLVQERLQIHAAELLPRLTAFSHGGDLCPLMAELWSGEAMGPLLQETIAHYGQTLQGVALVGGGNNVPAQQEEARHWSGVPALEVAMERTLLVIHGSIFAFDLTPAGSLDRAVVMEIEHGDGSRRRELLGPYRRVHSARPVQQTYEMLSDDVLRITVKTRDPQGNEIPVSTCVLSRLTGEKVSVIARPDRGGVLRVAICRAGVTWPLWEVNL